MDHSLQTVRDIRHKYIVVERIRTTHEKKKFSRQTAGNTTCCLAGAGYGSLQRKGWRSDDRADRAE